MLKDAELNASKPESHSLLSFPLTVILISRPCFKIHSLTHFSVPFLDK